MPPGHDGGGVGGAGGEGGGGGVGGLQSHIEAGQFGGEKAQLLWHQSSVTTGLMERQGPTVSAFTPSTNTKALSERKISKEP